MSMSGDIAAGGIAGAVAGGMGGGFEVTPDTLAGAQARLEGVTGNLRGLRGELDKTAGVADLPMAQVSAAPGWNELNTAWRQALDRLVHATETYAFNTEAAAVAYEHTDEVALPPAPPVAPNPEDLRKAREKHCQPDLFGRVPKDCRMA